MVREHQLILPKMDRLLPTGGNESNFVFVFIFFLETGEQLFTLQERLY